MERRRVTPESEVDAKASGTVDRGDDDQIRARLTWTPKQRLDYLLDMLAFEERAHGARRLS